MTKKTYIKPLSDLHFEFDNPLVIPEDEKDKDIILILAGDIDTGSNAVGWISTISDRYKHVIYIAGNHEYYHNDISNVDGDIKEMVKVLGNVSFLQNETLIVDKIRIIGSTLWTNFDNGSPMCMMQARREMNDYSIIRDGGLKLTPERTHFKNEVSVNYIEEELKNTSYDKTIVVTHHLPTYECIDKQYVNSSLNGAYASDLDHLFEEHDIDFWICGHSHCSNDFMKNGTRVIMNPYGYYRYDQNKNFSSEILIEI